MKIAVNTQLLVNKKLDGIGWFSYESLKRIVVDHPEVEFYFLFDRKPDPFFLFATNVIPVVIYPQSRHPFLWFIRFHFLIPLYLKIKKIDLYLSPDGWTGWPITMKNVQVLHDINFVHQPKNLKFLIRNYFNILFPIYAKNATRIATVSEFSKQDVAKSFKINESKIDVVYNGASEIFKPLNAHEIGEIRTKYTNGFPYFVFVGSLHPRKNILNLFKAFDAFCDTFQSDFYLVIAGRKMWWTDELEQTFQNMKHKDKVVFTGRIDSDELAKIMGGAHALTYVSFFEGFGIPLVEAMYAGIPMITSNCTSMPEVGGDAALYADPYSVDSIKDAMTKIASDEDLRLDLIEKGKIRKEMFSWNKTAELLWQTILKAYNS